MLQFPDAMNQLFEAATPYLARLEAPQLGGLSASVLTIAKITSGLISAVLFGAIVMLFTRFSKMMGTSPMERLSETVRASAIPKERAGKQWDRIKARIAHGTEAEWKLSVVEADKLCDSILRRMGYHGENMDQRLKSIKPVQLASLENLKQSHRIYMTVIEDPSFFLSEYETQEALRNYETFLKEMQLVD